MKRTVIAIAFVALALAGCQPQAHERSEAFVLADVEYVPQGKWGVTVLIAEDGGRHCALGILETPPVGTTVDIVPYTPYGRAGSISRIEEKGPQ